MARSDDLYTLPAEIAVPQDDGACAHLPGQRLPSVLLASTSGGPTDLSRIPGRVVLYVYPRTGRPDAPPLVEDWNLIPGARGCTPQSCAFRDHHAELAGLGAAVFGLSTQDTHYQREMVERLHLPFPVLSDARLELATALKLPTFTVAHTILIKRLTLIARDGAIETVFYPVFPPDRNAADVVAWLRAHPG
jgi:peroxiredoxin